MLEDDKLRFHHHLLVPEIGASGQQLISQASILIIGLGGLGAPAAFFLAGAGIGKLVVCDFDCIDLTNLHRQVFYRHTDIGQSKAVTLQRGLLALNPGCVVRTVESVLDGADLATEVAAADVVLDCTDNFSTRFTINRACVAANVPLVSGAAINWQGQVFLMQPRYSACYECLYPPLGVTETAESCTVDGVVGPMVGVIGSLQALLALRLVLEPELVLPRPLLLFDAKSMQWHSLKVPRDPMCTICGGLTR